jgi:autotransporter strand-loop-strand O-heptosyltransferase
MRITQITPGIITIPPNGWGAIEKVIWNYKLNFESKGYICDIKYLNEIKQNEYDIVHIHVANLALEAKEMGIPYIFSLHDHHVYRYGKDSELYKQNLEAIKGSIVSFCHAEFLVDFFENTDKLFYISHGVDITYFTPSNEDKFKQDIKLLCVANNGYSDDNSYDRKGFRYAIEAAKELGLPITIVGPENNLNFFKNNKDLLEYEGLNLITRNVSEDELLEIYRSHSIFIHPSELEAGHPNLTILEAISCLMPVVGVYDGSLEIKAFVNTTRNTESIVKGINKVVLNYPSYLDKCNDDRQNFDWSKIVNRLIDSYKSIINIKKEYNSKETKELYKNVYNSSKKRKGEVYREPIEKIGIDINLVMGAKVELKGISNRKYKVEFFDSINNELVFSTEIGVGQWCKPNKQYYTDWHIKVSTEGNIVYDKKIDLNNKKVYIAIDSSSIGDNLAWIPYVEEFRKKHNCKVVVSTFLNDLFKGSYKELEFINPGDVVENLYAMYKVGCFYDSNLEPELCNTIPLQKVATNILGLDYKEIKPIVDTKNINRWPFMFSDYVVIAPHSTAGLKYWNNPTGWQEVVDFLISKGFKVYNVSKEGTDLKGVQNLSEYSMEEIIRCIKGCKFFIGLSSGLSWLAWSLSKHVFLISNFTNKEHEFSSNCTRIVNESVCNSCWMKPDFRFDKGDWNWCPLHKGTSRQFECSKSITGNIVIEKIKKII